MVRPGRGTVAGLPAQTVTELPGLLNTLTGNVDSRRASQPVNGGAAKTARRGTSQ